METPASLKFEPQSIRPRLHVRQCSESGLSLCLWRSPWLNNQNLFHAYPRCRICLRSLRPQALGDHPASGLDGVGQGLDDRFL